MALHHNIRVDIPGKTYQRKQNNSIYIYYYTKFFRKNGKPSNQSVNIGKLDIHNNKLIPNDHYYEYFSHKTDRTPTTEPITYDGVVSVGFTGVLKSISSFLNLTPILQSSFPDNYSDILTIAGYSIKEGSIMSYIDDYMETHYSFENSSSLSTQKVSSIFSNISKDRKNLFFSKWIKQSSENDYIAYDVTSISTYSNNIVEAEYGYNRDHDDLKQINIGMFSATKSKLPVYYENYNGSITDKINLLHIIENARNVGINDLGVVMDGGFFDEDKLKKLKTKISKFTVGMPSHLDQSKELLDQYRNDIYNINHLTNYDSNYAMIVNHCIYGIEGNVMLGLNTVTRDLMTKSLMKDIEKREKELSDKKIKKYSTVINKKRYTELFNIEKSGETDYIFERNENKIEEIAKNYGYFLVFTTDLELSANDILYYYRQKDVDEKMFYQLKDYMGCRRLHTQNQATTDGKLFVLFIALIIRSQMYQKLEQYIRINHMTLKKCINKLENIQVIMQINQEPRLAKELTKQQREILDIFDIKIDKLLSEIR